ncbi:RHS repeat-associated core domain-containing protein [Promicromonospora sp. NPDC057488]|uniref:RHS repeat-associated core domain-containing protein n=1 Tax=Promicromonospora sp. NPDC057488 TaxID=3346147 RepID=UPI00366A9ED9
MTGKGRDQEAEFGRTNRRAWGSALIGAGLTLALVVPVTVPASAAENPSVAERQSWSLAERAEHDREFAGDLQLPEALPATEVEPEAAAVQVPDPRSYEAPISVTADAKNLTVPETKAGSGAPDDVRATVGGLPFQLESPGQSARRVAGLTSLDAPEDVRVTTLDDASAHALGVEALLTVAQTPQDGPVNAAGLGMSVDYTGLTGGNPELASRLGLVSLPACALSTPEVPACQVQTPLPGQENQVEAGTVTAVVEVPATDTETATAGRMSASALERAATSEAMVLAVAADAAGSEGDWKATPLSGAAAWETTEGTGSFTWSYPFRAPGTAGGLVPEVSLSYDSGSVDGRVASANTQTSEIGEGWDLATGGYVERKFVPCVDDQATSNNEAPNNADYDSGDLCWKNDNATLVLGGKATDLVKDKTSGEWRLEADDNTKVESLTGGWNGDENKEYWKVTTADGTQYWFGRDKRAADDPVSNLYSAWTVPVFGNHPGEPCYANAANGGFAASSCKLAWRWNLDYVVDTSGNTMTYRYLREWNNYGRNNNKTDVTNADYIRGGVLDRIDFGTREATLTATPSAVMDFNYAQRCIPTSTFDCGTLNADTRDHWPDVPQDQICSIDATSCASRTAPTFFTRNRLTGVETKILKADGTYRAVDSWALTHSFPDAGDGLDALWLDEVTHTGKGGGTDVPLPATQFGSVQRANRVAAGADRSAMNRMRIGQIRSESGAMLTVTYAGADCTPTSTPTAPESNTRRCMPVWWTPAGNEDPVMEWFHKYVVTRVIDDPRDGGSDPTVTAYNYSGGTAWRYTDDELTLKKHRTWSDWRGFATVNVYTGDLATNPDITRTRTQYEYFRGMHGDRESPSGGTKSVQVDGVNDLDQWAGMVRKETVYNGSAVVSTTVNTPWRSSATATDSDGDAAFYTGTEQTQTTTTTPDRAGGNLVTRTNTTFDARGRVETVSDLADVGTASDDTCTRTTYIDNTTDNILDTVRRVETVGVACSASPTRPGDVVSDQRFAYDGGADGAVPTKGLVTTTQEVGSYSGSTPTYVNVERTTYDSFGRPDTTKDANDRVTTTEYSTVQNLTTGTTVTSPDPDGSGALVAHKTVTVIDPAWGAPTKVTAPDGRITSGAYDALGRLTSVWEPGRVQGTHTASRTYAYTVRSTGVNAVTTSTLKYDASGYLTSVTLYDGLLRERQTQATSASDLATGRVITDTTYDTRGLAVLKNHAWHNTAAPSTTVVTTSAAVPGRTLTEYDGAGRVTEELFQVDEDAETTDNGDYILKWSTTTEHRGDRTLVDPPTGGTPTTTITDARGRTTALRQHTGTSPTTSFVETTYAYDDADRLTRAVDDANNTWTNTYDLRGRTTRTIDPDKGQTDTTYDAIGNVLTTTDARGSVIGYTYDALNRKTTMREGGTGGTIRARWAYDRLADGTMVSGQPTSSTRVVGTGTAATEITTTVDGYEAHGQPTATTTTIPATVGGVSLGTLAKAWTTEYTYTASGKLDTTKYPSGGGLPAETLDLAYDTADQVRGLGGNPGHGLYVAAADYKPTGEVARLSLGNTYAYVQDRDYEFGTNRLIGSTVVAEAPNGTAVDVQRAAYTWDHAGNLTSVFDTPAANQGGRTHDRQCYRYDGLRRLTQAWTPATVQCATDPATANLGGAAPYWHTYTHDTVGNRTQVVENALPNGTAAQTQTYTRPTPGENAVRPHSVTSVATTGRGAGTSSYSWDASGNMTGRNLAGQPAQQLSWDVEGELADVRQDGNADGDTTDANERDSYVYTADGERVLRTQDGTTTLYLGYQELTLNHGTGTVTGERYYTFAGQTIATRTGYYFADVTTIIGDHHNTGTVQIPNVAGPANRVHRYTDPYGKARGSYTGQGADGGADGNWTGEHGYLDKPVDTTGLTAIGARMYDPALGAFVSVDPIMDLADPQQWNAYGYSNNNPTTFSDPTGKRYEECGTTHNCTYNTSGNVTSAKKYPKRKPTIWDIRSKLRSSYGQSMLRPLWQTQPFLAKDTHDSAAARNEINAAKLAQAKAIADAAKARADAAANAARARARAAWLQRNFATWEGTERWSGAAADVTGAISFVGLAEQAVGVGLCGGSIGNGGMSCVFGGAEIAAHGKVVATSAGLASVGFSTLNAGANFQLGQDRDGYIAAGAAIVGVAGSFQTASLGRAGTYLTADTMEVIGQATLGIGTTIVGGVLSE